MVDRLGAGVEPFHQARGCEGWSGEVTSCGARLAGLLLGLVLSTPAYVRLRVARGLPAGPSDRVGVATRGSALYGRARPVMGGVPAAFG